MLSSFREASRHLCPCPPYGHFGEGPHLSRASALALVGQGNGGGGGGCVEEGRA